MHCGRITNMRQRQASPSFVKSPNLAKCLRIYLWADIHCSRDSAGSVQCVDLFSQCCIGSAVGSAKPLFISIRPEPNNQSAFTQLCKCFRIPYFCRRAQKACTNIMTSLWALLALNAVYGNTSLQSVRHCPSLFDLLLLELETNLREV